MDVLRSILNWIRSHAILSLAVGAILIGALVFARLWISRSQGTLSEPLARGSIVQSVYGIGTVTANRVYDVKPGIVKYVGAIYVREGDSVKKGQKLFVLDDTLFVAPFDGTVTYFPTTFTETLFANVVVLTLVDMTDRYIVVSMEQQGALQVRPGQKAYLSFDSIREQRYEGVVKAVYSNNNSFLARIDVENLPPQILPQMTADVAIAISEKKDVLLVPVAALEKNLVWVKRGSAIPRSVQVKTGIVDRQWAEVVSGDLREGDRVIIRGKAAR